MQTLSALEINAVSGGFDQSAYNAGKETGTAAGSTTVKGGKVIAAVLAVVMIVLTR